MGVGCVCICNGSERLRRRALAGPCPSALLSGLFLSESLSARLASRRYSFKITARLRSLMVSRGSTTRFLLADDRVATSSLKSVQPFDISDPSSLRSWSFKARAYLGTIGENYR